MPLYPQQVALGAALAQLRVNSAGTSPVYGSAGQIPFPATQNPSANVNTLDDYEEGTWTPTIGGTTTYTTQTGVYLKVGSWVQVSCILVVNAIGAPASTSIVTGLPFSVSTATGFTVGFVSASVTNVASITGLSSGSQVQLYSMTAAAAAHTANAIFGAGATVYFQGTYQTSG